MMQIWIKWKKKAINNLFSSLMIFLYLLFLIVAQNSINIDRKQPFSFILIISFICLLCTPCIVDKCKSFTLVIQKNSGCTKDKAKIFALIYLLSFLIQLVWLIGYYPGAMANDNVDQLNQFLSKTLNDHHPALHTILVLGIPYSLFHSLSCIILIQNLFFSLAFSYAFVTLYEYGCPKGYLISMIALVLLNPFSSVMLLYPLKDTTMAILLLIAVTMFLKIYFSDGRWLTKINCLMLSIVLTIATIIRHNAILFTGPLLLLLFMYTSRDFWKRIVLIFIYFIVFCWVVTIPIYQMFHVQETASEHKIAEMYGLPMTVLGNVMIHNSDKLDDDTKDFLYEIGSLDEWKETYQTGSWNSMKWAYGRGNDTIEQKTKQELLEYFLDGIKASPADSMIAVLELTNMVWSVDGKLDWYFLPTLVNNDLGFEAHGVSFIQNILRYYWEYSRYTILKYIYWFLGVYNLLFIVLGISKGIKKFGIVLPALCYNFGTMLLLCGNDFRFFYYTYLIAPLLIFMLIFPKQTNSNLFYL